MMRGNEDLPTSLERAEMAQAELNELQALMEYEAGVAAEAEAAAEWDGEERW